MNIFKQFIASLYSPKMIAAFRHQKIGRGIGYVFLLMFITLIPIAIALGTTIHSFVTQLEKQLEENVPDFAIENGVLSSTEVDEPVINEEDGQTIVFDPTGSLTENDLRGEYTDAIALLEREAILITNGVAQESIGYQDFGLDLTKQEAVDLISSISGLLPLIIGIIVALLYLFFTAGKFIGVTVLALLGLMFRKSAGVPNLTFKHCWVIAAFTVTMPTVLFSIIDALHIPVPFQFGIYWVIAIVMLFQVFRNIPRPSTEEPKEL